MEGRASGSWQPVKKTLARRPAQIQMENFFIAFTPLPSVLAFSICLHPLFTQARSATRRLLCLAIAPSAHEKPGSRGGWVDSPPATLLSCFPQSCPAAWDSLPPAGAWAQDSTDRNNARCRPDHDDFIFVGRRQQQRKHHRCVGRNKEHYKTTVVCSQRQMTSNRFHPAPRNKLKEAIPDARNCLLFISVSETSPRSAWKKSLTEWAAPPVA